MPYCPECGVEVDFSARHCPLCRQEIPVLNGMPLKNGDADERFPIASNIHDKQLRRLKNQILFGVTLVVISALFSLGFLHSFLDIGSQSMRYGFVSTVYAWFYIVLMLGYVPNITHTVMSAGMVSAGLVIGIDRIDGKLSWSLGIGMPIIALGVLIALVVIRIYKRFKHKNQYVVVPIYLCTCVSLFCPVIEAVIDYHVKGTIHLTWSVMTVIPLMTIACVLLGLYLKLPERIRSKIIKKLHI